MGITGNRKSVQLGAPRNNRNSLAPQNNKSVSFGAPRIRLRSNRLFGIISTKSTIRRSGISLFTQTFLSSFLFIQSRFTAITRLSIGGFIDLLNRPVTTETILPTILLGDSNLHHPLWDLHERSSLGASKLLDLAA